VLFPASAHLLGTLLPVHCDHTGLPSACACLGLLACAGT
jgi:hypothetical protein